MRKSMTDLWSLNDLFHYSEDRWSCQRENTVFEFIVVLMVDSVAIWVNGCVKSSHKIDLANTTYMIAYPDFQNMALKKVDGDGASP